MFREFLDCESSEKAKVLEEVLKIWILILVFMSGISTIMFFSKRLNYLTLSLIIFTTLILTFLKYNLKNKGDEYEFND